MTLPARQSSETAGGLACPTVVRYYAGPPLIAASVSTQPTTRTGVQAERLLFAISALPPGSCVSTDNYLFEHSHRPCSYPADWARDHAQLEFRRRVRASGVI